MKRRIFVCVSDKDAATELQTMVDDACSLLTEYNSRLSAELEERKQVARLLRDFILAQKDELQQAQEKLDVSEMFLVIQFLRTRSCLKAQTRHFLAIMASS